MEILASLYLILTTTVLVFKTCHLLFNPNASSTYNNAPDFVPGN